MKTGNQTKAKCFPIPRILCACVLAALAFTARLEAEWVHESIGTIVYSVFVPKGYSPDNEYPMIMYLHGIGQRGTTHSNISMQDMKILAHDTTQAKYPHIVYAPQCPGDDQWAGYKSGYDVHYRIDETPETEAMKSALVGLEAVIASYSIDTNIIVLSGGSMGGFGVWDILCRHPENRFAAAIPIAGGGDSSRVKLFATRLPIWAFHGKNDATVPVRGQQNLMDLVKKEGGMPPSKFTVYTDDQLDPTVYSFYKSHIYCMPFPIQPDLMPWIFAQDKSAQDPVSLEQNTAWKAHPDTPERMRKQVSLQHALGRGVKIMRTVEWGTAASAFDLRGRKLQAMLRSR